MLVRKKQKSGSDVVHVEGEAEDADEETAGADVVDLLKILKQRISERTRLTSAAAEQATASADAALEDLPKEELYQRAQVLDIAGRSKMGKKKLAEAIRKAA